MGRLTGLMISNFILIIYKEIKIYLYNKMSQPTRKFDYTVYGKKYYREKNKLQRIKRRENAPPKPKNYYYIEVNGDKILFTYKQPKRIIVQPEDIENYIICN